MNQKSILRVSIFFSIHSIPLEYSAGRIRDRRWILRYLISETKCCSLFSCPPPNQLSTSEEKGVLNLFLEIVLWISWFEWSELHLTSISTVNTVVLDAIQLPCVVSWSRVDVTYLSPFEARLNLAVNSVFHPQTGLTFRFRGFWPVRLESFFDASAHTPLKRGNPLNKTSFFHHKEPPLLPPQKHQQP